MILYSIKYLTTTLTTVHVFILYMDKNRGASVVVLVLLVLGFFTFYLANANTNRVSYDEEDGSKKSSFWVWERFRRAYSMYSSIFPTSVGQYWHMVKAVLNNTYAYFFPPTIDFRKGGEVEAVRDDNGVKEAFSKSIGTSKATLEEVAKSAAEKVKRSLSHDRKEKKGSARQTIRRRQALSEELSRKAASLVLENENLKRKKELALKEYQSLETTNKLLKAQVSKSINTKVEKTPVEHDLSMAEVAPMSGNSPWFHYNRFPVRQLFWPSIFQSSNQVHTPFNSIAIPSHVYVPRSSESESPHKQDNLINDNRAQNPLYMFPCPWLYPPPDIGNGQPSASSCVEDKQDNLPLDEQCSTSLSLNRAGNGNYHATLPIKLKTESTEWTKSISTSDPGHTTPCFSSDGVEQKTRCHNTEKFHRPAFDGNGHASVVKQEPELQLNLASNTKITSTASGITTSSLENKQEQFICPGKNLVDTVAAAEARKRRKELTKLKSNQSRRMEC